MATAPPSHLAGSLHLGLAQALSAQGRYGDLIDEVKRAMASRRLDADAASQLRRKPPMRCSLLDASRTPNPSPPILERALASEAAASALAATGAMDQAKPMFNQAVNDLSEIGADRDAGRVLGAMRKLGFGRRRRGRRAREANGWESIIAAELEVVRLAAGGLTNPEIAERLFLSPRTVQGHLSHAFRKLDISSRVELAAEVGRREGPLQGPGRRSEGTGL